MQASAASLLGLRLSDEQLAKFERLTGLLLSWNERMNLTAITDPRQIVIKHYLDALTLGLAAPQFDGMRLLDVGAGAGFPGLPLAIAHPKLALTLLDATAKKLRFVEAVSQALGLRNVGVLHARAEDASHQRDHREGYDIVVARAVAKMPVLAEYTLPFCRLGGKVIAMKGSAAHEETQAAACAIAKLGGALTSIYEVRLPTLEMPRHLVVITKVKPTAKVYPRQAGTPSRQPL